MRLRQYQAGPVLLSITDETHFSLRLSRVVIVLRGPKERPLFSERYGHQRVLRLGGGWRITLRKVEPIAWRFGRARLDD